MTSLAPLELIEKQLAAKRGLTRFAKKVYSVVLTIPLGQVRTYKWVAKKIGSPKAVRAIGQILKRNPFLLLIPCHRVIRSDGKLGGYILGEAAKRKLIMQEKKIVEIECQER